MIYMIALIIELFDLSDQYRLRPPTSFIPVININKNFVE